MSTAARIHELLRERGMEQKALAQAVGKSDSWLSKRMAGDLKWDLATSLAIAEYLDVDVEYLAGTQAQRRRMVPLTEADRTILDAVRRLKLGVAEAVIRLSREPNLVVTGGNPAPSPAELRAELRGQPARRTKGSA